MINIIIEEMFREIKNMENMLESIYKFARDYHENDNSGHDAEHIRRVYENVCLLLPFYADVNEFVVKAAALLHDIDDRKLGSDGQRAKKFLEKLNISESVSEKILDTISSISFSTTGYNPHLDTLEKAILFDADKLDAIGAIGICRAVLYGAKTQRPLFDPDVFPMEEFSKEEYKKNDRKENTTINHFFDKLLKLKDIMQTEAGKAEAERRHVFMVDFLKEFFSEQKEMRWLEFLENQEK